MKFFDGLYNYEIILLGLGAILFFVLLFVLILLVVKNRPIKVVIPLFLVAIIMMGFPGIQKIKYDNGVFELEKWTKAAQENPEDQVVQEELASKLAAIQARPVKRPATLKTIQKAQLTLGNIRTLTPRMPDNMREVVPQEPDSIPMEPDSGRVIEPIEPDSGRVRILTPQDPVNNETTIREEERSPLTRPILRVNPD